MRDSKRQGGLSPGFQPSPSGLLAPRDKLETSARVPGTIVEPMLYGVCSVSPLHPASRYRTRFRGTRRHRVLPSRQMAAPRVDPRYRSPPVGTSGPRSMIRPAYGGRRTAARTEGSKSAPSPDPDGRFASRRSQKPSGHSPGRWTRPPKVRATLGPSRSSALSVSGGPRKFRACTAGSHLRSNPLRSVQTLPKPPGEVGLKCTRMELRSDRSPARPRRVRERHPLPKSPGPGGV